MDRTHDTSAIGAWPSEPGTLTRRSAGGEAPLPSETRIQSGSEVFVTPVEWEPHTHAVHELVWVRGGTLTARVGDRLFTVPEGYGLWLPAGVRHGGRLTRRVELHGAFFAPDRAPTTIVGAVEVAMSPVLHSLLMHLARTDLDPAARARAEAVVFDVLEPADAQLSTTVPDDRRIAPVVTAVTEDPADDRGLDDWARSLGVSERTITRAFRDATGLSFAQWRRTVRVHRALSLLSEGWDVQSTAEELGYAQSSTFIAAFRRVMGTTPGVFGAQRPTR